MKREYAEAYVRWADTNLIDLDMWTGMGVIYAVFAFPLLVFALVVRQVVFPYIYIALCLRIRVWRGRRHMCSMQATGTAA